MNITQNLQSRFLSKVGERATDECWPWLGAKGGTGYGHIMVDGKVLGAHRVAYAIRYGTFDDALVVMHRCDNRLCCNPSHLRLGTIGDNNRDRSNKGRGRENRQWGVDNSRAKLTAEQVNEIRRLVAAGMTQTAVALLFGIKQPHVSRIVRGATWRHL